MTSSCLFVLSVSLEFVRAHMCAHLISYVNETIVVRISHRLANYLKHALRLSDRPLAGAHRRHWCNVYARTRIHTCLPEHIRRSPRVRMHRHLWSVYKKRNNNCRKKCPTSVSIVSGLHKQMYCIVSIHLRHFRPHATRILLPCVGCSVLAAAFPFPRHERFRALIN